MEATNGGLEDDFSFSTFGFLGAKAVKFQGCTLPQTNSSHLEMEGLKMIFPSKWHLYRGELLVSGGVPKNHTT